MKDDIMTKTKDFLLSLLLVIIVPFWLLAALVLARIGRISDIFRKLKKPD